MARPKEVVVAPIGLTVLNPELSPNKASVESVSQPCGKIVLTSAVSSSFMVWVGNREKHGPTEAQTKITSPLGHRRNLPIVPDRTIFP